MHSSSRRRNSSAAADEYVSTRIEPGVAPWASRAKRRTSADVLPVPAPPRISNGPFGWVTASVIATGTFVGYGGNGRPHAPALGGRPAPRRGRAPTPLL